MTVRVRVLAALAAAAALTLSGCSGGSGSGPTAAPSSPTASAEPSSSTPTSPATVAPVSLTPGQQRVMAANNTLTTSLFALTSASAGVRTASNLAAQRQAVADALAVGRAALARERASAYGSVRDCTAVRGNAATTWAAAARARSAVAAQYAGTARMRASLGPLQAAAARVTSDLAALRSAVAAEAHPPTVLGTTEVQQALAAASTLRSTTLADAAATDAKGSAALGNAAQMSGSASTIASKAC